MSVGACMIDAAKSAAAGLLRAESATRRLGFTKCVIGHAMEETAERTDISLSVWAGRAAMIARVHHQTRPSTEMA